MWPAWTGMVIEICLCFSCMREYKAGKIECELCAQYDKNKLCGSQMVCEILFSAGVSE